MPDFRLGGFYEFSSWLQCYSWRSSGACIEDRLFWCTFWTFLWRVGDIPKKSKKRLRVRGNCDKSDSDVDFGGTDYVFQLLPPLTALLDHRCAETFICRTAHLARREYTPGSFEISRVVLRAIDGPCGSNVNPACVHAGRNGVVGESRLLGSQPNRAGGRVRFDMADAHVPSGDS
jgi:hypothetical protein